MVKSNLKNLFGVLAAVSASAMLIASEPASAAIGVTAAVNQDAFSQLPAGKIRTLVLGDQVIFKQKINTAGTGLVQVLFTDGSTITVGPNASLVIDEYVYDPDRDAGKLAVSFGKGVMRFIGGKLSKKRGRVKISTRVGTAGIRGGMANIAVYGNKGVFSLLFGKELRFTGVGGQKKRIYRAGYSLVIRKKQGASYAKLGIRRTRSGDTQFFHKRLAGVRGLKGGASHVPTEQHVAASGLPQHNSRVPLPRNKPAPPPQAVKASEAPEVVQEVVDNEVALAPLETVSGNSVGAGGTNPSVVTYTTTNQPVRVLSAANSLVYPDHGQSGPSNQPPGPAYQSDPYSLTGPSNQSNTPYNPAPDPDVIIDNPGQNGIVGNTAATTTPTNDQTVIATHSVPSDNSLPTLSVPLAQGSMVLHPATTTGTTSIAGVSSPWGNLSGTAYKSPLADFTFYSLFPLNGSNPDINRPVYLFHGTGPSAAIMGNGDLRTYSLRRDPRQDIIVPFTRAGLHPDWNSSGVAVTDVMVTEPHGTYIGDITNITGTGGSNVLQASMLISGTGTNQYSFVSVGSGMVFVDNNDKAVIGVARSGSVRTKTKGPSTNFWGFIGNVNGPDGNGVYGDNAEVVVLSSAGVALEIDRPFIDVESTVGDGVDATGHLVTGVTPFSTIHVGELTGETPLAGLTRTTRTINGYATGIRNTSENNGTVPYFGLVTHLDFNAATSQMGGEIALPWVRYEDQPKPEYNIRFGSSAPPVPGGSPSFGTFVDDDRYAVAQSEADSTVTTTTRPITGSPVVNVNDSDFYLVSSDLARQDGIFAPGTKCNCEFLEWGYWGARFDKNDNQGPSSPHNSVSFHMGTWVAGDITREVDLPTSGSATYNGHAVGNVVRTSGGVTNQYIATGRFNMNWNFASRTGSASISNFDGVSVNGGLVGETPGGNNHFSGVMNGAGVSGDLKGSFVNGPAGIAQGAIGQFGLQNASGTFKANGIVAGKR